MSSEQKHMISKRKHVKFSTEATSKKSYDKCNMTSKKRKVDEVGYDSDDLIDSVSSSGEAMSFSVTHKKKNEIRKNKKMNNNEYDEEDDNFHGEESTTNNKASLVNDVSNEYPIEAFNLNEEREGGGGYFDGDTYVFRSETGNENVDDAWADGLEQEKEEEMVPFSPKNLLTRKENSKPQIPMQELYRDLVELLDDDTITVEMSLSRLKKPKMNKTPFIKEDEDVAAIRKRTILQITDLADEILMRPDADGNIEIYQCTKLDLLKLILSNQENILEKKQWQWYYRGNKDDKIHGPFTTQQMIEWKNIGYFVGDHVVDVSKHLETTSIPLQVSNSTSDELIKDLFDDVEKDQKESLINSSNNNNQISWVKSNTIDFRAYI